MAEQESTRELLHRALDKFLDYVEANGYEVVGLVPHYMSTASVVALGDYDKDCKKAGVKVKAQVLQPEVWFRPDHLGKRYRRSPKDFYNAFGPMFVFAAVRPGVILEIPRDVPEGAVLPHNRIMYQQQR